MTASGTARLHDGGRLEYVVHRDLRAATPVLLHRPLGGSMTLWGELATRLADVFPVIAFDPRGVGASGPLPLGHGTREMARDAIELLDALGVTKAHHLGLSLGGMVASWVAIDAPSRVDRLVLVSTLPRAAAVSRRVRHHALPLARAVLRHGVAAELGLVRDILSPQFVAEQPARVRELERLVRRTPTSHRNLAALALAALRHDASSELHDVAAPTLLVFGGRDELAGRHARHELAGDIPGARLEMVAASGHDVSLEQPQALAALVIDFLTAADGARSSTRAPTPALSR